MPRNGKTTASAFSNEDFVIVLHPVFVIVNNPANTEQQRAPAKAGRARPRFVCFYYFIYLIFSGVFSSLKSISYKANYDENRVNYDENIDLSLKLD